MSPEGGRRMAARTQRRSVSPALLIGAAAVLVTGVTIGFVADPVPVAGTTSTPPVQAALTTFDLACPAGPGDTLTVASPRPGADTAADSAVTAQVGAGAAQPVELTPGGSAVADLSKDALLRGTGALAAGLVAARVSATPTPTAGECGQPGGEFWFTGVGAGGLHSSTLTLANPDPQPAIADLEVWSATGPVASVDTRGLAVDAGTTRTILLEDLVPLRDDLVLRVVVRQGRLAASMLDRLVPASGEPSEDFLAATAAPATRQVIPAVPGKATDPVIVIGNPGDTAGRAAVKVSGASGESAPLGMETIPLGAGEVKAVPVTNATMKLLSAGQGSLVIEGTVPVVASMRAVVASDLVLLPAVPPAAGASGGVLPAAPNRQLVLSATETAAPVTVHFVGGKAWEGRLQPGVSTAVDVPADATAVWIEIAAPHVAAVRGYGPKGVSWLPLRALVLSRAVPDVQPDLRPDRDG